MSKHSSKTTTNHDEIRRWAEARRGKPACVKGTGSGDDPGMIRLDFPGYSGEDSLEKISWDEWFKAFDDNNLALVYQDETASGEKSNFNKLVARETAKERAHGNSHASRSHGNGSSSRGSTRQTSSRSSRKTTTKRARKTSGSSAHKAAGKHGGGSRSR